MTAGAWIPAGQSNMEGFGLLDDPRARVMTDPRVKSLTTAGEWQIATEPLHRLWESFTPVHRALLRAQVQPDQLGMTDDELAARARTSAYGAGLGLAFGTAMAEGSGRDIALIPTAHGGTTLEQWSPEHAHLGGRSLYGGMIERARYAAATADTELAGILWYQGESDCVGKLAETYAERFDAWIAAARRDLGAPALPVYVVQLGRWVPPLEIAGPESPWLPAAWETVREAIRTLPERTPYTGVTSAIDLPLVDPIHIDSSGLARLGYRLARMALSEGRSPAVTRVERLPDAANGVGRLRVVCSGVDGEWWPRTHLPGFVIKDATGRPHSAVSVIEARPLRETPGDLEILLSHVERWEPTLSLGYGLGLDPVCFAVDASDMPLPAFSPQAVRE